MQSEAKRDYEVEEGSDVSEASSVGSGYPPSIQAGIPSLGELPQGWSRHQLGQLVTPVERPATLVDSQVYQLVTARRSRGGIVAREQLRADQIRTKTQFSVKSGDFLISNRQISHGGCGVVPAELDGALVSNEYTVLRVTRVLDPGFLKALSHSIYFQQTCFHSSVGIHVEKLVFRLRDWLNWPFNIPPMTEQRRIADALDTWDRAIDGTERLIAAKRRVLDEHIRLAFRPAHDEANRLPAGWSRLSIRALADVVGGGTPDTSNDTLWNGDVAWCTPTDLSSLRTRFIDKTARQISAAGLKASSAVILPSNSVVLCSRASVGACAINRVPMSTNQGFQSLVPKPITDSAFLYYLIRSSGRRLLRLAAGSTFLEFSGRELAKLVVAAPDLNEQLRVSRLLSVMDDEIDLLAAKLEAYRTQRRGLLQKLLSGERRLVQAPA